MMYNENHEPEQNIAGREIAITWVFALSFIGIVLLVIGLAD